MTKTLNNHTFSLAKIGSILIFKNPINILRNVKNTKKNSLLEKNWFHYTK